MSVRFFLFIATLFILPAVAPRQAMAQPGDTTRVRIYPPELYPGINVVTVSSPNGLREITLNPSSHVEVEDIGDPSCETSKDIRVVVSTATVPASLNLRVVDCKGKIATQALPLNNTWQLDSVSFGTLEQGLSRCQDFSVRITGIDGLILDSVTVNEPNVHMTFPSELPARIPANAVYRYLVCFQAEDPGYYKFPVVTWIRRQFPSGGYTTYPVADTGTIIIRESPLTDPTTFRSVAVPNAIIPKKGKFVVGSYDLLGVMAGYSVFDELMILGGGALPTPDDWGGINQEIFGAYSLGFKAGIPLADDLHAAIGFQWGASLFDRASTDITESQIDIYAPYAALSYGNDDRRISATFGYAFKHHTTLADPATGFIDEYTREAPLVAIGGDYRIGHHWKLAGEAAWMRTLGVVPIVATGRWFTDTYAIDFGAAFVGIATEGEEPPKIPLLPVISGVFVF